MLEKHKILIIGSGGMLGADLCEELGNGYDLVGSDLAPAKRAGATNFIECDITDKGSVKDVIDKVKPQIVIHAAAWTDVDGCERDREKAYRINASGTENVAVACKNAGAILIYISTDFVFDGKKKEPYTEEDKTGPLNIYAASKLAGEEAVRKNLKEYFILRTSWLYGAGGKNFVDTIIAKAGTEKELKVVRDQSGSPTYTKDLACAIHRLAD
ncbi:MAG: dTDP-4-dehydrorhamnose reductase, partial [Candidatus Omnitrophica bacterium]|nr:dTDP-4-dehydrorhamnose reductase [Candidatus Omnitrophota bacterium]